MTCGRFNLDQVKDLVTVADVLEGLGHAAPAGRRRIPCPIHGGTGANFSQTEDGRRWRCWSVCAAGGDVLDLVMRLRACDTGNAIAWCAELAGLSASRPEELAERQSRQTAARRLSRLRAWRSRERMRLAGVAHAAERANMALHVAGPDSEAAWNVAAAAAIEADRAELRDHELEIADDVALIEIWRTYHAHCGEA